MPKTTGAPPPEPDATTPTPQAPASAGASSSPDPDAAPTGRLAPGVYEYTAVFETQYVAVPLTARPAIPAVPATDSRPAAPASPATVFDWPDGAPDDDRWTPTAKRPNQWPDNHPADPRGV